MSDLDSISSGLSDLWYMFCRTIWSLIPHLFLTTSVQRNLIVTRLLQGNPISIPNFEVCLIPDQHIYWISTPFLQIHTKSNFDLNNISVFLSDLLHGHLISFIRFSKPFLKSDLTTSQSTHQSNCLMRPQYDLHKKKKKKNLITGHLFTKSTSLLTFMQFSA